MSFDNKLDKLDERLDSIDRTLVRQQASLEEHMRRSELNEKAVSVITDKLEPVIVHVAIMQSVIRLLAWAVGVGGLSLLGKLFL